MSKLFSVACAALAISACTPGASISPADEQNQEDGSHSIEWIAIGTSTLQAIEDAGNELTLVPAEIIGDVALVPMTSTEVVRLSVLIHESSGRCGGFTAHSTFIDALAAARQQDAPQSRGSSILASLVIDNAAAAQAMLAEVREPDIRTTIETLSAFRNRLHSSTTGHDAPIWIRDFWQTLTAGRPDITVELVDHNSTPQQSVMMTITGTTRPDEVVVIGGHLDSIAGGSNPLAPGADDDASGIATISEITRAIVATDFHPERTIHIIGYAAEEVGLRGSREIAQSFANNNTNVIAVMQFDMTNFNGSNSDIVFIRDRTDDVLTNFVGTLVDTYLPELVRGNGNCGYACSDHASWNSQGFPTVFPFEAQLSQYNPNIHTPNDTLTASGNDAVHAVKFAKLGATFVAEVAKGSLGNTPPPPNPNSCVENNLCGGRSQAPGGCWCDDACVQFGDCCSDGPC